MLDKILLDAERPRDCDVDALEGKHLTLSIKALGLFKIDEARWKKKK